MNSIEIGKNFEKEVYNYLNKNFDKVIWLSKKKWHTPIDFECYKNGKKFMIDAKKNGGYNSVKVDFIAKKSKGVIQLINPELIKSQRIRKNFRRLQADIPKELNQLLKMHKVRNDFVSLEEALIDVLCKFFKQPKKFFGKKMKDNKGKFSKGKNKR